jgi:cobalamin biosynthesis Mg chelatase CobN
MGTVSGSFVPMPATLPTGLEVYAMDKKTFQNEATFQITLHLARKMLAQKLITEKEYRDFEKGMIRRWQPFSRDLFTC